MIPFSCCCNYATVIHIGIQTLIFLVLSVIIAYCRVITPYISKTHLPIHLMYLNSNLIDTQKTCKGKWEAPLREGTPPTKP